MSNDIKAFPHGLNTKNPSVKHTSTAAQKRVITNRFLQSLKLILQVTLRYYFSYEKIYYKWEIIFIKNFLREPISHWLLLS